MGSGRNIAGNVLPTAAIVAVGLAAILGFFLLMESVADRTRREILERGTAADLGKWKAADADGGGNASVSKNTLRVAIAPVISPASSLVKYRRLLDYLEGKMGVPMDLVTRPTYMETNELLRTRAVDLAMVCTYAYVRAKRDFGLEILVIPVVGGRDTYNSYLVATAPSEVRSLLDLSGKRFASSDLISTSGWLYPALWLKHRGVEVNGFFSEHIISGSHDQTMKLVAEGGADGAAVDSIVFDSSPPEMRARLVVFQRSPDFGMPPFVVPIGTDPEIKASLRRWMLEMESDPAGREILASLGFDEFILPRDGMYDEVERMVDEWEVP